MEINDTLYKLEETLSFIEFHADSVKKAIVIAKEIKAKYDGENLTEIEDDFSDKAGNGARRFNNATEIYGDMEVEYLFKILSAVEEYEKAKRDNDN